MGYSSNLETPAGSLHVALAYNPSHLEIVNPVVLGQVRARQERRGEDGQAKVVGVLIHGDSALGGLGVNQTTFNLSQTQGYGTGGTLHLVINNQIGFTHFPLAGYAFFTVLHRYCQNGSGPNYPR